MKDIWLKVLEMTGKAFWIEVKTAQPACTYFFGPFASEQEATEACPGYVADLQEEGAEGIETRIQQMKPTALTIDHSLGEPTDHEIRPSLSGQPS